MPKVKCPTCRTKTEWEGNEFRPFCSERCRLIDLGKWLDEEHRIETEAAPGTDSSTEEH